MIKSSKELWKISKIHLISSKAHVSVTSPGIRGKIERDHSLQWSNWNSSALNTCIDYSTRKRVLVQKYSEDSPLRQGPVCLLLTTKTSPTALENSVWQGANREEERCTDLFKWDFIGRDCNRVEVSTNHRLCIFFSFHSANPSSSFFPSTKCLCVCVYKHTQLRQTKGVSKHKNNNKCKNGRTPSRLPLLPNGRRASLLLLA